MRLAVLLFLCVLAGPVFAQEAGNNKTGAALDFSIRVVIIQCGTQGEARKSCESRQEARCCAVVDDKNDEPLLSGLDAERKDIIAINDKQRLVLN